MKRSRSVVFGPTFLAAAAAATLAATTLTGRSRDDPDPPDYQQICVNEETNIRVDDDACDDDGGGPFVWYYIPYHLSAPPVGSVASGGSRLRPPGTGVHAPVRGGFGGRSGGGS